MTVGYTQGDVVLTAEGGGRMCWITLYRGYYLDHNLVRNVCNRKANEDTLAKVHGPS